MQGIQNINNMMMTRTMTRFFRIFLAIDSLLVIYFIFQDDYLALLNSQIGALSAMAVAVGSYIGYKQSINNQVQKLDDIYVDDRDLIDKIDDPHELFDEDDKINENEISDEEAKAIFKEEKEKLKKQSTIKNVAISFKGIFSPFRIVGYILLVIGFFWLEKNGNLQVFPYLFGLSILPISTIVTSFKNHT